MDKIDIILSATSTAFTHAIESAQHSVHQLVEGSGAMGEQIGGHFESLGNLLSGGGISSTIQGLGSKLTELGGEAASAATKMGPVGIGIGLIGGAAVVATGALLGLIFGLKEIVEPQMEIIATAYRTAAALNLPTEALMAFQAQGKHLGLAANEMTGAFEKLSKKLGEAAFAGEEGGKKFARFGLDAQDLAKMPLDEAMGKVADKLKNLSSATERATLVNLAFGKGGMSLLPILMQGSEGMEKAKEEALKYGFALNAMDASKVAASQHIFGEVGERLEGIKNTLTVALAPAIEFIGEKILGILPDAETLKNVFTTGIDTIIIGLGYVVDGFQLLKIAVLAVATFDLEALSLMGKAVVYLGDKILDVIGLAPGMKNLAAAAREGLHGAGDMISGMATAVHERMTAAVNEKWGHEAAEDFITNANNASSKAAAALRKVPAGIPEAMEKAMSEAEKRLHGTIDSIKKDLDLANFMGSKQGELLVNLGMNPEEIKKIFGAIKDGANPAEVLKMVYAFHQLNDAAKFQKGAEGLEKLKKELADLKSGIDPKLLDIDPKHMVEAKATMAAIVAEHNKINLKQKFADAREELELLKQGFDADEIALKKQGATDEELREWKKLQEEKKKLEKKDEAKDPQKIGAEVVTVTFKTPGMNENNDIQGRMAQTADDQLKEQKKTNEQLGILARGGSMPLYSMN